jgi:hypothetical protein
MKAKECRIMERKKVRKKIKEKKQIRAEKVKLSRYAMQTSSLNGSEWSVSRPGRPMPPIG